MTLTGMLFVQDCEDHYHVGEIVRQCHPDAYLVRYEAVSDAPIRPLTVLTVTHDFSALDSDGHPIFRLFETHADRQAWIDWLDTPVEKPAPVARLVKKEKTH